MDIQIQVNGQKAKITNRHELYSGTVAITGISFDFSKEWFGMTKTATIYVGSYDRDKAVNILIENDRVAPVQLPPELFEKNCELYVGVFAIDADGRRLTSSIVRQEVKKGVPVQNASDNVSIDVYTRIIQLMTEAKDIAANSDEKIESNKKYVEQAKECLKQIDSTTTAKMGDINALVEAKNKDIDSLVIAKMGDIANVTNAKIEDINNTASAQISNINNVTNQNIASSTDAVNAAARSQIKGITETTQGKIKDINNTALSQIEAINNTATSQIKSINNVAQENINVINGVSDGNTKEIATALDMIVDTFEKKIAIEKPYYAYLMDFKIGDFNDDEITKVREYVFFEKKSLTSIDLPVCTSIGDNAFSGCTALNSINLPVCTSIGTYAFYSCKSLTSIDLPVCTSIGPYTFYRCTALTSINLPVCTSIDYGVFSSCTALTSINLPVCTSIEYGVFSSCTALTSINLPACTSIHSYAFNSCKSLTSIKLANTSKICTLSNSDAFKGTPIANKAGYIYVPDELVEQYKKATNWSVYASQIKPLSAYTEE